jgi:hypothetical protein
MIIPSLLKIIFSYIDYKYPYIDQLKFRLIPISVYVDMDNIDNEMRSKRYKFLVMVDTHKIVFKYLS